ncbi:MAG: putative sulfate exporter family transporter, partial [Thermacetogeniaceae bacterium]
VFTPFKELSKFFIILAMAAIGLNTNMIKLVKSSGKPIILGFCCWLGIIAASLALQQVLAIW